MGDTEKIIEKYVKSKLKESDYNYPKVLGLVQTLLSQSMIGTQNRESALQTLLKK